MSVAGMALRTICGIEELPRHSDRGVRDVLSILDPERVEPAAFAAFAPHRRLTLRFHDDIEALPGRATPGESHVAEILAFGESLARETSDAHLLVHCHMGVSRSTAAMLTLMAQAAPREDADALFARLATIRPQAWPNSRMIAFADALLGRGGTLTAALARHYARQIAAKAEWSVWMADLGRQAEIDMGRRAAPA